MTRLLELPAPDPPLVLDASLRPEGRQGPLVRSLAACRKYYASRSATWEYQALLRAEFAVGDASLGADFIAMADEYRYPAGGLPEHAVREIRRIKARVEAERIPRGADRALHLKLGPGGLSDVEWTVQLLQLRFAAEIEGLRTTSTLLALDAALEGGLVDELDAETLASAWRLATRVRNALVLARGKPADSIPTDFRDVVRIARMVGYSPSQSGDFLDVYRRVTRRSRAVVDKVFYA
jgi:glutamate-ammonia-ligase adenylyltransferase